MAVIRQMKAMTTHSFSLGGSISLAFDSAPLVGSLLVAGVSNELHGDVGLVQNYSLLVDAQCRVDQSRLKVSTKTSAGAGDQTVSTANYTGTRKLTIFELFPGSVVDGTAEVDNGSVATTNFSAPAITAANTGLPGVMLVFISAYYPNWAPGALTPIGSIIELTETYFGDRLRAWAGYQEIASLSGSYIGGATSNYAPGDQDGSNTWGNATVLIAGPLAAGRTQALVI